MQKRAIFGLLCLLMANPSQAINGHALKPVHVQALKSMKKPIAVPYYVPDGCEAKSATVEDAGKVGGLGYAIQYICPNQTAFMIEATSGGMGDGMEPTKTITLKNKQFGSIYLFYHKEQNDPELTQYKAFYATNWIGKGPMWYMFKTGNGRLDSPFELLHESEAVKIVQSIGLLK